MLEMQRLYGGRMACTCKEGRARVEQELREEQINETVDEVCLICSE